MKEGGRKEENKQGREGGSVLDCRAVLRKVGKAVKGPLAKVSYHRSPWHGPASVSPPHSVPGWEQPVATVMVFKAQQLGPCVNSALSRIATLGGG